MGRPRKYATDADRAAAYRARYAVIDCRLKPETVATLDRIAASRDISRADLLAELVSFALANRNWHEAPAFTRSIVSMPQARGRRVTKYQHSTDEGDNDAE